VLREGGHFTLNAETGKWLVDLNGCRSIRTEERADQIATALLAVSDEFARC
jgi:hypothetical protein